MGLLRLIAAAQSRSIFRTSMKAINNFRYSTTCTRSVSSSPWLMLPPEEGGRVFCFYSVADNKVVSFKNTFSSSMLRNINECEFVGSSHGWLALFNRHNYDLLLFNPLTSRSINLPSVDTIVTPTERTQPWVFKIITTCPPDSPQAGLCRAVMLYDYGRLAYCTPGSSTRWMGPIDPHFTPRPDDWGSWGKYDDFVHYSYPIAKYPMNNLLICIGDGLEAWNIHSNDDEFQPKRLVYQNRHLLYEYFHQIRKCIKGNYFFYTHKHLVEYNRQIFLVFREAGHKLPDDDAPQKTLGFHVHKIWQRGLLGEREGSLDGLSMFVGRNHSFALPAADYPGLMPNSIYFTQHWSSVAPREDEDFAFGGHDIGVFDYENNTISPCYYPCDEDSYKRIVPYPMWFTPNPSDF